MQFTKCNYSEERKEIFVSVFTTARDKANLNILQTYKSKADHPLLFSTERINYQNYAKIKQQEIYMTTAFFLSWKETFSTNCLREKILKHKFHTMNSYLYRLPKTFVFRRIEKS